MRLILGLLLALILAAAPRAATAQPAPVGIVVPRDNAVLRGVVSVWGVAHDPDFARWQLDLLPDGNAERAAFLATGDAPGPAAQALTDLDTTRFADGPYTLRLRVVRRDSNYDEHQTPVTIANAAPAPGLRPAAPAQPQLRAGKRAAALGLPVRTANGRPILYFTFDDGPSPVLTPQIVALLDQYDARVTFFVIGVHVRRAPAALRPVAEAGHAIANHTLSHKPLVGKSRESFAAELTATEEIVQRAVGDLLPPDHALRLLRPPGGATDAAVAGYAAELGYQVVTWDIDPKDWRRPGAEAIASYVLERVFPGAIVVLHDGGGGSRQTVAALETILRQLSAQGYVFRALTGEPEEPAASQPAPAEALPCPIACR